MKNLLKRFFSKKKPATLSRKELEKKVIAGAKKTLNEHRELFKRLAEYDKV